MLTRKPIALLVVPLVLWSVCAMTACTELTAERLLPRRGLSETGLYDSRAVRLTRGTLPLVPQYPLWSDGAEKFALDPSARWRQDRCVRCRCLALPGGHKAFWKEFSWGGRKVETRDDIEGRRRRTTGSSQHMSGPSDQTDATLAPRRTGVANVVNIARGKKHSIPAKEDCRACHQSSPAVVLGFNALQLSDDRDPLAPHAEPLPARNAITMRETR